MLRSVEHVMCECSQHITCSTLRSIKGLITVSRRRRKFASRSPCSTIRILRFLAHFFLHLGGLGEMFGATTFLRQASGGVAGAS